MNNKQLSNPSSTSGRGVFFENHVQSAYVTLMLTDGHAPCLPCWPIVKIKLQGKIDGYDIDDLIIFIENNNTKEQRKMMAQIKNSIAFNRSNKEFKEVISASWSTFNNSIFTKDKDCIALIVGRLSKNDSELIWVLNHARVHATECEVFYRNINTAKFSSENKKEKLKVMRDILDEVSGQLTSDAMFFEFIKNFYILSYDIDEKESVVLSLLYSHISQFNVASPHVVWDSIKSFTSHINIHAGIITRDNLPETLINHFIEKPIFYLDKKNVNQSGIIDFSKITNKVLTSRLLLFGSWDEKNTQDIAKLCSFINTDYTNIEIFLRNMLIHSPLVVNHRQNIWSFNNKKNLWEHLCQNLFDSDLENFKDLAIEILSETSPSLSLPPEHRYASNVLGKNYQFSLSLRHGIAESLVLLAIFSEKCIHCTCNYAKYISSSIISEILNKKDWTVWASIGNLLPILSEADPDRFLNIVSSFIKDENGIFDDLYNQELDSILGISYMNNVITSLEKLSWHQDYIIKSVLMLAKLSEKDPGGKMYRRPLESLTTIFLAWHPQTVATWEKRKTAIIVLLKESPEVAWKLLYNLMPKQKDFSSGTSKPQWILSIPSDWRSGVTDAEYWEHIEFFSTQLVENINYDTEKLIKIFDILHAIPQRALSYIMNLLKSEEILSMPEEKKSCLWEHLSKNINKNRKFSDAHWALSLDLLLELEEIANALEPLDTILYHQYLFSDDAYRFFSNVKSFQEQEELIVTKRNEAVYEIYNKGGITAIIDLASKVDYAFYIGTSLAEINISAIESLLLPNFLSHSEPYMQNLVAGFIRRLCQIKNDEWICSIINESWTNKDVVKFITLLPFTKKVWDIIEAHFLRFMTDYWKSVRVSPYECVNDIDFAVKKLLEADRPRAAINCMSFFHIKKESINPVFCKQALLNALNSEETDYPFNMHQIRDLIVFLQQDSTIEEIELAQIEWGYLPFLNKISSNAIPVTLERMLASDSEFFCSCVRAVYRSTFENSPKENHNENFVDAAWNLLEHWSTPPGTLRDGSFNSEIFKKWIDNVKESCITSGHIDVALNIIGEVLIYAPSDESLWINNDIALELDKEENEKMRSGYMIGTYNSRGVHWVDTSGKQELELEAKFLEKAEVVECSGYLRFADTLRKIASHYRQESLEVIQRYH